MKDLLNSKKVPKRLLFMTRHQFRKLLSSLTTKIIKQLMKITIPKSNAGLLDFDLEIFLSLHSELMGLILRNDERFDRKTDRIDYCVINNFV